MTSAGFRLWSLFGCVWSVFAAWLARCANNMEGVVLPAVASRRPPGQDDVVFAAHCADMAAKVFAARSGRRCFFRSFALAHVLRRAGMDVILNIGLRGEGPQTRTDGHCWLTMIDGSPVVEKPLPVEYPVCLGDGPTGVRYWAGPSMLDEESQVKKEV